MTRPRVALVVVLVLALALMCFTLWHWLRPSVDYKDTLGDAPIAGQHASPRLPI